MKKFYAVFLICMVLLALSNLQAKDGQGATIQRKATNIYDVQRNTLSNFDFYTTNYGIFGLDVAKNSGAGFWPRGTLNQYLFGSGIWIGALKKNPSDNKLTKMVEIGYNPNSGQSWFVPGAVQDGDKAFSTGQDKYRTYFSTDFDLGSGEPIMKEDGPNWPLWIVDDSGQYQYGTKKHGFIYDETKRNKYVYIRGPQFVSDEDIVTIYKDTDLDHFEGGVVKRKSQGYPMKLEIQSRIYTWKTEEMKDVTIMSYLIENKSTDTLYNCWVGGVFDSDIAYQPSATQGATNDRMRYFETNKDLNLTVGWTNTDKGEAGKGFGYIGISMLESPAVDNNGFIRTDKMVFEPKEQLGMVTSRNWSIVEDLLEDNVRYDYMSSAVRDGDNGPGDKRMMLATGPFNLKPGDVGRVVFSINFALPAKGGEADGTDEDIAGFKGIAQKGGSPTTQAYNNSLIGKLERTIDNYYNMVPSGVSDEIKFENGLTVCPNPATDAIYLPNESICQYKIYSMVGSLQSEGTTSGKIDVSKLSAGMYYIKIGSNIAKFVKM
jgi:hypothetical protein